MAAGNNGPLPGSHLKGTMNINELEASADQIARELGEYAGVRACAEGGGVVGGENVEDPVLCSHEIRSALQRPLASRPNNEAFFTDD